MSGRPLRRRALVGLIVGIAVSASLSSIAHADAAGPSDYRSEIVEVRPATGTITLSIEGGDSFVRIDVDPGHEVIVLGYAPDREPYLRISADGMVEQNVRSYATYYNADRFGRADIPDVVDVSARPEWEQIGDGGTWSWHDHRAHWMGDEPPIGLEPGDALPDQDIELVVDGQPVVVTVRTTLQPSPSVLPVIAGVLIGLAVGLLGFTLGPATANLALLVAAASATLVGAAQYLSLSAATGPLITWWLVPAIALACAVGVIAIYGRSEFVQLGLIAIGGLMLVLWGFRRRDVLGAAVLPTDLPFWFDRMVTAATPIVGLLVLTTVIRAVRHMFEPPEARGDNKVSDTL